MTPEARELDSSAPSSLADYSNPSYGGSAGSAEPPTYLTVSATTKRPLVPTISVLLLSAVMLAAGAGGATSTLSMVSPAQYSTVSGQVTLRALESNPNVAWVGFYPCDGKDAYEDLVPSNGYWEVVWDSTTCPNGDRNLALYSFDNGGNILAEVPTWWLTVSNSSTPPPAPPPPPPSPPPSSEPAPIAGQGYTMRYQDLFDGPAIDRTVWCNRQWWEPSPPPGVQYIDANGVLHVVTRRSDGYQNTSISSEPCGQANPKSFQYGYMEARMRWTRGNGSTPAFWLFSTRHATNPAWPNLNPYCAANGRPAAECYSGEIDVFEGQGHEPRTFIGTIHRNSCGCYGVPNQARWGVNGDIGVDMTTSFHTYGLVWTQTEIKWYLDGVQIGSSVTPFDSSNQPMHLIFYQWPQSWSRDPDPSSPDELHLEVDWVRVWQKVEGAPVNTVRPALSGTAREGQPVTTTNGTWTGTPPITYSYSWFRCDSNGDNCSVITGANSQSYVLTAADVGSRVFSLVTATNAAGSASQRSYLSALVVATS